MIDLTSIFKSLLRPKPHSQSSYSQTLPEPTFVLIFTKDSTSTIRRSKSGTPEEFVDFSANFRIISTSPRITIKSTKFLENILIRVTHRGLTGLETTFLVRRGSMEELAEAFLICTLSLDLFGTTGLSLTIGFTVMETVEVAWREENEAISYQKQKRINNNGIESV